jgi:hypothetical protein
MVNRCSEKSILKELIPLGIVLKEESHWQLLSKIAAEYNYNNPSASIQIWRKPML